MDNSSIAPNQTLYINHLNEKIKLDELKSALFQLCSQYGEISEIIASKTIKRRGQAFIVFTNTSSAEKAQAELNDQLLFGKRIGVAFAKTESDCVLTDQGLLSKEAKVQLQLKRKNRRDMEYKELKDKEIKGKPSHFPPGFNQKSLMTDDYSERNSLLFIDGLPKDIDESLLKNAFNKYLGFKEIRLHSGRGVCFVEYDNEMNAESAMIGLSQMNLNNECILNISFAKK